MKIPVKGVIIPTDDKWIYDWFGMDSTTPRDIEEALSKSNGLPVDVEINSGGGDIFAGSEIYTQLRGYKPGVRITVVGLAASAASVIAMAGPSEISPTAMVMVHNVTTDTWGDYRAMDHSSDVLKRANRAMAAAYIAKSGMSEKDALAMMDKETWLTAQQAIDVKLIDRAMFSDTRLIASFGSQMLPFEVIQKMRSSRENPPPENVSAAGSIKAKIELLRLRGEMK